MHTPPGAFCCCKPAQSTNRLEPVIRRAWQSVLGETSPGHLAVELAPNSSQGRTTDGLRVWSAEVAARAREPGAAAPPPLAPKVLLQSPAGRPCACGGSYSTPEKRLGGIIKILGPRSVQVKALRMCAALQCSVPSRSPLPRAVPLA